MEQNRQITKPITLLRNEFVTNVVDLCNNASLPFFVIEDVLKGVTQEVHAAAQQQLKDDTERYNALIKSQEQASSDE